MAGFKPVDECRMVARAGGTLILLIPAPDGIAPDHLIERNKVALPLREPFTTAGVFVFPMSSIRSVWRFLALNWSLTMFEDLSWPPLRKRT